jgi:hypothetical protein
MAWEYKVVVPQDAIKNPSLWQLPSSATREYADLMEDYLNRMADDGWELVTSCPVNVGQFYLIFRRLFADSDAAGTDTHLTEPRRR